MADGPTVQPVPRRDAERGVQVRQHGASGRRRSVCAVRAQCIVRDAPAAQGADHRRDHADAEGAGTCVVVGVAGRQGAELGVGLHPEALGAAAAPARRPAVVEAATGLAGEVRRRAQGLDVRELPPPVSPNKELLLQLIRLSASVLKHGSIAIRLSHSGTQKTARRRCWRRGAALVGARYGWLQTSNIALQRFKANLQRNISSDFALLGLQLVHQRPCPTVEADDRGDVRGSQEGLCRRQ
jgi:hypothetical protein